MKGAMTVEIKAIMKERRQALGLTLREVADACGVSEATASRWESGEIANMRRSKIAALAAVLQIPPTALLGDNEEHAFEYAGVKNIIPLPRIIKKIPLYDGIACGDPMFADSREIDLMELPDGVRADFALCCHGDSMIGAHIRDGDIVYIRKQEDVDDGEIAAVLIDDDATLKRIYHKPYGLLLMPANDAFEPMIYTGDEGLTIRIMGKAVACLSQVR